MPERRRAFRYLAAVLVVLVGLLAGVAWLPVRRAREAWRAGRVGEAVLIAGQGARWRVWPRQYRQILAASELAAGRRAEAERHLNALRGGTTWVSAIDSAEVARRLFARGAYEGYLAYDAASGERRKNELDRAVALLALNRIGDAEAALRAVDRGSVDPKRLDAVTRALAKRRSGAFAFALDRNGKAIDVAELFASQRVDTNQRLETTLDAEVQELAVAALGGRRGSLVAIDPRTNEVLAMAGASPFKAVEPGSVMKVLTLLAALENGVDVDALFPYTCSGALKIDGRSFGDWRAHGVLADVDEALAQSCNTVFADLGLRVNRERLRALHQRAGFDGHADLGLFRVALGKSKGNVYNNFETAFYAIGLKHETVTPFHLAMLASMLANRGVLTTPRIYRVRRSMAGDVLGVPPKPTKVRVASPAAVERAIAAMQAVVTRPQGTGRRAAVDNVTLAIKTGTSGTRDGGYDAVVYGFAPAQQPKIAFAVYAENAGSAELAGAEIVRAFIAAMAARGRL